MPVKNSQDPLSPPPPPPFVISMGWGVVGLVVLQGPLPCGLVWTHINDTYSQVTRLPLSRLNVCLNVCLVQLCRFPGQISVLPNKEDSQVKCLSRATGWSGHTMVWSWTTHIRSSHMTVWFLGQMSVQCSSAMQPPGTHIHTYQHPPKLVGVRCRDRCHVTVISMLPRHNMNCKCSYAIRCYPMNLINMLNKHIGPLNT